MMAGLCTSCPQTAVPFLLPRLSQVTEEQKQAFQKTLPTYRS